MVKRIPLIFLKQFVFWMLYFQLGRCIFVLFNFHEIARSGSGEMIGIFLHAIYLDISAACYIMSFPFLLLFLQTLINTSVLNAINKAYSFLIICVIASITSSEIPVYKEWGTKLHYKALGYLRHPSEIFSSATNEEILVVISLVLFLSIVSGYLYHRFFYEPFHLKKRNYIFTALFLFIAPFLIGVGLRGGLQQIPINQSDVYFSKSNVINLAAVNSAWNLMHSIEQNKYYLDHNPYVLYPDSDALQMVRQLHDIPSDTFFCVLNNKTPNIVFIILESWSADLVASLGGDPGITPCFDTLSKSGLLFTNCYASGDRSDQGITALFSGFPAQPTTSIIKQPDKYQNLPCVISGLKRKHYATSFLFGGQLNYGNIKGYVYYNGFDRITEGKDLRGDLPRGKLGVHDEFIFNRLLSDIDREKEPFFSAVFTLSTHSPYDQPMKEALHWGANEKRYINSAYYTDSCLGDFFNKAKKKPWYKNTLFILSADHSHNSYRNHSFFSPEYRKIPVLFYGDALKPTYRGYRFDGICSQVDIPATLLAQLHIGHAEFEWSKNVFNPGSQKFAYYCFVDGMGWIRKDNYFVYQKQTDRIIMSAFADDSKRENIIREGRSYLQVLFQEYLDY